MLVLKFEVDFNAFVSMNVNHVDQVNHDIPVQFLDVLIFQESGQVRVVGRNFLFILFAFFLQVCNRLFELFSFRLEPGLSFGDISSRVMSPFFQSIYRLSEIPAVFCNSRSLSFRRLSMTIVG